MENRKQTTVKATRRKFSPFHSFQSHSIWTFLSNKFTSISHLIEVSRSSNFWNNFRVIVHSWDYFDIFYLSVPFSHTYETRHMYIGPKNTIVNPIEWFFFLGFQLKVIWYTNIPIKTCQLGTLRCLFGRKSKQIKFEYNKIMILLLSLS